MLGWPVVAGVALLAAGACGPLLTGGFSSLTAGFGAHPERARGIDTLTYGIAGTAGPAAVAGLAAVTSPATSLLALAGAVLAAAIGTRWLPAARGPTACAPHGRGKPVLLTVRPLRQVTVTTVATAATGGMLAVLAVLLAVSATGRPADGAWLVGAVGLGNLVGAGALALLRPPALAPVRAALVLSGALGGAYLSSPSHRGTRCCSARARSSAC